MLRTIRPFFIAVICAWIASSLAGWVYFHQHPGFHWLWTAVLPAFILETLFYLGSVFENTRVAFRQIVAAPRARAGLLWISALLPYLVFSLVGGTFAPRAFYLLAVLTAILAFWHVVLPRRVVYDAGFLIVAAAPFVARVFPRIYRSPDPGLKGLDILGHLMWIRLGLMALLVLRDWNPGPVSLWPKRREWGIGLLWFAIGIVPICAVALAGHDVVFAIRTGPWWRVAGLAAGTFLGALWVIALGEELFFRGVVERAMLNQRWSPIVAVVVSSILYASTHLWYRGFPDWRRFATACALGLFCGLAYWRSGGIRGSMVTHACTIVTWKMLFSK